MEKRRPGLEEVLEAAAAAFPAPAPAGLEAFGRALLVDVEPRFARTRGVAGLAAIVQRAFRFARERETALSVRVENPADCPGRSVIQVAQPDRPFLVDTTRLLLRGFDLRDECFLHPVLRLRRPGDGTLVVGEGEPESVFYVEVAPCVPEPAALEAALRERMSAVAAVTDDYGRMIRTVRDLQANLELAGNHIAGGTDRTRKIRRFLDWLVDGHFVFFASRGFELRETVDGPRLQVRRGEGRGLMRADELSRFADPAVGGEIPEELGEQIADHRVILIGKARLASTIHRAGRLDRILVKEHDESGRLRGFTILLGLFTHRALRTPGSQIPVLAERLETLLAEKGAVRGSHRYKAIVAAFDSTPTEFLLGSEPDAVARVVDEINAAESSEEARLVLAVHPNHRSLYAAVVMPRSRYRDELRDQLATLIEDRIGPAHVDCRTSFLEESTALINYFCTPRGPRLTPPDAEELGHAIQEKVARWQDLLVDGLIQDYGESQGLGLAALYAHAFPESFRVDTHPEDAARDVAALEALAEEETPQFALYFDRAGDRQTSTLKVFLRQPRLLSDLLPAVHRFGIRVVDARRETVRPHGRDPAVIVSLHVLPLGGTQGDLDAIAGRLSEALRAVLMGAVADDDLNGLLLLAGLEWREIDCLRAYLEYFVQIQGTLTPRFIRGVLLGNPIAVRLLVAYHRARLDPSLAGGNREAQERAVQEAFEDYRRRIGALNEDRALGGLFELVDATVRTTFFAPTSVPHRIAFKLDPARISEIAPPHPFREIVVHGAGLFGIHIRGGAIARGGIRWSDRTDDLRTEVLGLMRTQMLKNGLIVPVGAKGGFVIRAAGTPQEARAMADAQYRQFIAGLLDLTDDLSPDGRVVPPAGVHRRDGDDPYLVVAADKGTAHLSDTANEIAVARGFWLGDAFASGGCTGYDHKRWGITARGAWACVKHHFAEIGIDGERDSFTVAGIGDMSGDVFGNGLLLARRARLLAAFDHRHIFLDPEPDVEAAFLERRRLFELPRSSWADFDPAAISAGGGVFPREAKRIPLAPPVRAMLGLEVDHASGEEVIRAILGMEVDLLWNGGIGTYVKAASESHADVRDRANDAVRIDAGALRARVVGEGGNLGLTQRARIEAALAGVRLDSDAIHNSAGVDLSDHEVNLKILLAPLVRAGELSDVQRNELLHEVADETCERVVGHNRSQALCISLDERRSREDREPFLWAIDVLCRAEGMAPAQGELPDAAGLERRGGGLTRPELAWLLGLAKLHLRRALVEAGWQPHPCAEALYRAYFPDRLAKAYPDAVGRHRLRREIAALAVTNHLIDLGGVTLIPSLMRELEVPAPEAATVALLASRVLAGLDYRKPLLAARGIGREETYEALAALDRAIRDVARLLASRRWQAIGPEQVRRWSAGLVELHAVRSKLPKESVLVRGEAPIRELEARGFGAGLALDVASASVADLGLSLLWVAEETGASIADAAVASATLGVRAGLNHVYASLDRIRPTDPWDRLQLLALRGELLDLHAALTGRVLAESPGDPAGGAERFVEAHRATLERARSLEARALVSDRPSAFAVVMKALQRLGRKEQTGV